MVNGVRITGANANKNIKNASLNVSSELIRLSRQSNSMYNVFAVGVADGYHATFTVVRLDATGKATFYIADNHGYFQPAAAGLVNYFYLQKARVSVTRNPITNEPTRYEKIGASLNTVIYQLRQ